MLIGGIVLGLIAGLVLGGKLGNLADVRLRYLPLLFLAVIVRFGTETALAAGVAAADALRLPLFVGAYGLLLVGLWANRRLPGLGLAFVGILGNAIAIVANGGYMPIWTPSLEAAGFRVDEIRSVFHVLLDPVLDAEFLRRAGPLGDIVPIPFPIVRNVASIGDLFLSAGLGFFLFAVVLRSPVAGQEEDAGSRLRGLAGSLRLPRTLDEALGRTSGVPTTRPGRAIRPETGLARGLQDAAALERPLILGGHAPGLGAPALAPLRDEDASQSGGAFAGASSDGAAILFPPRPPVALPRPSALDRARRHPYVRLALDPAFSALWSGQLISVFGDRVHQIAMAALVYALTGSEFAVAFSLVSATLPNLFLSPIAGAYVDRWNPRHVMVVSDLLRAAVVLLIPVVAVINVLLLYPMVFLVTSISVFFRPARVTILPRIVRGDDILPANSALWVGETFAELFGYPLAAVFVIALGSALPLAFWFDAATYVASAVLIGTIAVRPVVRSSVVAEAGRTMVADLRAGWQFLRRDSVLLANTVQGALGQIGGGMFTAVTFVFAVAMVGERDGRGAYAAIETGIGAGNLIGGFVLGLVAARMARGRLIIGGFITWGLATTAMGLFANLPLTIGLAFAAGIANMVYVIPSQTLFQERTPPELLGRVVGFRFAAVFGALTLAMAVGGLIAELLTPAVAVVIAGLIPLAAGIAGLFVRAVREA